MKFSRFIDKTGTLPFVILAAVIIIVGCTTSSQRPIANSLQAAEATAVGAVSAYYDGVLKGVIATNDVPTVAKSFNDFQAAYALAIIAAQNNTNALAPTALVQEGTALVNLITTVSHK